MWLHLQFICTSFSRSILSYYQVLFVNATLFKYFFNFVIRTSRNIKFYSTRFFETTTFVFQCNILTTKLCTIIYYQTFAIFTRETKFKTVGWKTSWYECVLLLFGSTLLVFSISSTKVSDFRHASLVFWLVLRAPKLKCGWVVIMYQIRSYLQYTVMLDLSL